MFYVTMTDKFMSGWGYAAGKTNKLIIECADIAQAMQVDVEIQNHPIFDDTPGRIAALAIRAAGAAHPFVMGNARYLRFWDVVSECMQASLIQREAAQ